MIARRFTPIADWAGLKYRVAMYRLYRQLVGEVCLVLLFGVLTGKIIVALIVL